VDDIVVRIKRSSGIVIEVYGKLSTGRFDRIGKEIFEGDTVEVDDTAIGGGIYQGEVYYCTDYTLEENPCFAVWTKMGHAPLSCSARVICKK
jgi:hypothetical protein